jgi:thiol-disulfide isomerase/thioredoxin
LAHFKTLIMRKVFTSVLFLAMVSAAFAGTTLGKGMDIKLTVKGLEGTQIILANYYGDKQYVKDTFMFDKKGMVNFKADTMLPGGVYLAVFPAMGNRYFEFIISEAQFSLETDTFNLIEHMKVINSKENTLFYDDMKYLGAMKQKSDSVNKLYREAKDQPTKDKYMAELRNIDNQVKDKRSAIINGNPDMFYGKLIKSMKDIDVPDFPRDAAGKVTDSTWQWRYYKWHYWDNVDLRDDRLLRCPVLHNKLKTFIFQTTVQHPDSIIVSGEDLLAKTDKKGEMYRYILTYIFNEMANSKIMGYDGAYVHFGKEYFCKPDMTPWIDTAKRFKICDRVRRLEPVLVGKKAQRLILWTDSTETQWRSLYDVKAKYTVVAFWDPDCGHCKKEMPQLAEAYHNLKKMGISVEVYSPAIMDMDNYKDWVEFIQKNNMDWINVCDAKRHNNFRWEWDIQSTPQLYILDAEKTIVARRIAADQIEDYIRHLEDPSYKPKNLMKVKDEDTQEGTE